MFPLQVSVRWERTRLQLVIDGVQVQGHAEPDQLHEGAEGSQAHTLFVGGLPVSSHRPKLPVRTAQLPQPCPQPSQMQSTLLSSPGHLTLCPPLYAPTGGRQQLMVQRLCEESEIGRAAPEGPHSSGGGHALLVRPPGEGPVLCRQRGSRHSRSACCPYSPSVPQLPKWGNTQQGRGLGPGPGPSSPHSPFPADTLGATLPDVSLELEVRPQTATGLILHLGGLQVPPHLQLQVLEQQVSWVGAVTTGQARGWQRPPDAHLSPPSPQVLLWADDGAGKFSTLVTLSRALCDGQWHQLAGELGPFSTMVTPPPLLVQSR